MSFVSFVDSYLECITPFQMVLDGLIEPVAQPVHILNEHISDRTMKNPQQSMYLTIKILSFAFALFYRVFIPNKFVSLKYAFNLVAGVFIVMSLYKSCVVIIFLLATLAYVYILLIPRSINRIVTPVTFFILSFLITYYDQLKHYNQLRYSFYIAGMQFVLRISSLVFCLHDGATIDPKDEKVPRRVRELAVKDTPSPLRFYSYCLFHGTVLNPPPFEYKVYVDSIEDEENLKMPIDWKAILNRLLYVLGYLLVIGFCTKRFGWHDQMVKMEYTQHMNIFEIYYNCSAAFFFICCKLIFAGMFAEMVCITSGIGYRKNYRKDKGEYKWDYIKCVDPYLWEMDISARTKIQSWNMTVERWFRYYFYYRLTFVPSFMRRLLTGWMAAFWHGHYIGLYLFYALAMGLSQIYVVVYKKFARHERFHNWFWWILVTIINHMAIRFICGSAFFTQTWDKFVYIQFTRLKGFVPVLIFGTLFVVQLLPGIKKKKKKE